MTPAIKLHNITKTFDLLRDQHTSLKSLILSFRRSKPQKYISLNDINLSIGQGETVAIIGKNGSGKSTLLCVMANIYKPTTGSVHINGRLCTLLDPGAGFHPELTGRENIFFNGAIMGLTTTQVKDRLDAIIDFSELNEFIDSAVKTYSAGMLMRLGFSIAVETDPDILLIDEALAVGDAEFQAKCYKRIDAFKEAGRTIVFVTHDLDAARLVASRTIWLHKGEIRADGDTQTAINLYLANPPTQEQNSH